MTWEYRDGFGNAIEALDEFDAYGVEERDALIELARVAEEDALAELAAFGCIEQRPQFDWSRKSSPEERGWSIAMLDVIAEIGADTAETVFELF